MLIIFQSQAVIKVIEKSYIKVGVSYISQKKKNFLVIIYFFYENYENIKFTKNK